MYRIIRITVLILPALICQACEDWLDLRPEDELVQDQYWQTKEDVSAVLMSAYQQLAQMDERLFVLGELRADMVSPESPTTAQRLIMQGNLEPDNPFCNWADFYKVVNYCNYVLEFAQVAYTRDPTFTEFQLRGFESEALFLRSLAYFYLVRIWRDVPLVLLSSKTDDQDFFPKVSSEGEVLTRIKDDLIRARLTSREEYGDIDNNKGRASRDAINALLADICLWQEKYEEAVEYCNSIDEEKYLLLHGSQWFTLFYPGNSMESIFELQYNDNMDQPNRLYNLTYLHNRIIASEYAQEILDPQLSREVWRASSYTYLHPTSKRIWKYAGTRGDHNSVRPASELRSSNLIIYRYSDVLLMKAEALNRLGRHSEALEIVNMIRSRAFVEIISPPLNTRSIEDVILLERAKEFAFEGKRWFDLLRMGRRNDFERKNALIERMIQNVPPTQKLVLSTRLNDPNGWYFPIHINELEANLNLRQNPFYRFFQ